MGRQTEIKIAYIGGGSRNWARIVMTDLALCPHLTGELALYDIDRAAAERNVRRARHIFDHRDAKTRFETYATKTSAQALKGADFVFLSILPGPVEMMVNDLDIPARYGILQPVGDTTGPGGISRAMRAVPTYQDYAHQIMRFCPNAWVINYTNPMTLCVAALYAAEPEIKAFGCCHEVFGTQGMLAGVVADEMNVRRPKRQAIHTEVVGVNHFTFARRATWRGRDLYPTLRRKMRTRDFWKDRTDWSREQKRRGIYFASQELVAFDFLRRYGVLGAAGDRHLAEFVPWYAESEETLHRYGVVLTPSSYRLDQYRRPPEAAPAERARPKQKPARLKPSGEEGVGQLLALLGFRDLDTNVNLPNRGQIPWLPQGAVVETNAALRRDSVTPLATSAVPAGLAALIRRVVDNQQLTLAAAMAKDTDMAFQAVLNDPLCTIPTDSAWRMFKELTRANGAIARQR